VGQRRLACALGGGALMGMRLGSTVFAVGLLFRPLSYFPAFSLKAQIRLTRLLHMHVTAMCVLWA
jgi:hypothetical protein